MEIVESFHWEKQKNVRTNIENYMIEYVIYNSQHQRDKTHKTALNAVARIPENGKKLKVVFRWLTGDKIKLITCYYSD